MPNCKKLLLLSVLALAFLSLSGGNLLAGTEGIVNDSVYFGLLNEPTIFVEGTTDPSDNEIARLDANVYFAETQPGSYLEAIEITMTFDTDFLSLVDAVPSTGWGEFVPADYSLDTLDAGNPMKVSFMVQRSSSIPVSTSPQIAAHFDFVALCAVHTYDHIVNIEVGQGITSATASGNIYSVVDQQHVIHGSIKVADYVGELWVADTDGLKEYQGVLDEIIEVPVLVQSNFRVGVIDVYLDYDDTKLELQQSGFEGYYPTFQYGSASVVEVGIIRLVIYKYYPSEQFTDPTQIGYLRFKVIGGDWQGDDTQISISSYEPPKLYVGAPGNWCDDIDPTAHTFHGGTVAIDAYAAAFVTEFTDGGTVSDHDCEVDMMINMSNNFASEAAQYSIIANLNLGTDWGYVDNSMIEPSVNFSKNEYEGDPGDDDYLGFWTEPDAGSIPIQGVAQPLVGFSLEAYFGAPANYDDRWFPVNYSAIYGTEAERYARVRDFTSQVELTDGAGLTWDAPEVEYLMGEFSSPSVQAGNSDITQTYYTQNNFILDDFRVKIIVSGPHYMKDITPIAGVEVESFDAVGYKWAILRTDPLGSFEQAPTSGRVAFADILYTRSGASNLVAKETDPDDPNIIVPPGGHWVTETSTVSFEYDSPGEFYMAEAGTGLEHHVVAVGGTVVSKWWVDADVNQLRFGLQLPEDFELLQNYPNPFNPSTEIAFGLPTACRVELVIYNIAGQLVENLVSEKMTAGWHSVTWDGDGFASGIYLYRLQAGDYRESQKMILLK